MNGLVGRIRWGNIGRIGAVIAAVGLVVAWPKLKSHPPEIPPAATVPAVRAADPVVPTPVATEPEPKPEKHKARKRKRKHKRKKRNSHPTAAAAPSPVRRPVIPVAPAPAPPKPEFQPFG